MRFEVKSWRVVVYSLFALGFIAAAFITKNWLFVVGAVILMMLNQYELTRIRKKSDQNKNK